MMIDVVREMIVITGVIGTMIVVIAEVLKNPVVITAVIVIVEEVAAKNMIVNVEVQARIGAAAEVLILMKVATNVRRKKSFELKLKI